jgi:23S rRNA (cytidine2498-2'-O)-methyltransferase
MTSIPRPDSHFVFVACNIPATRFCRAEIARKHPDWLPAFSRPGFLTFKLSHPLAERFELPSTFARSFGNSLVQAKVSAESELVHLVTRSLELICQTPENGLGLKFHVWDRTYSPKPVVTGSPVEATPRDDELAAAIQAVRTTFPQSTINENPSRPDARVIDLIRLDTGHWATGHHVGGTIAQRWPGGFPPVASPSSVISRAWYKLYEALLWSGLPISPGDICVEIGSAPGGSCQRLLEMGARVIAVDPAELDPAIRDHPNLKHLRMRGRDIPHREMAGAQWLLVDSNIAPESALEMSEALLASRQTRFRGAILTLKMLDEELAASIDTCLERVRSWGFGLAKARHLAWGRQEICVALMRNRDIRRSKRP